MRVQIFVSNELLSERRITVRSLSSWTKEDAAEWILTLGMIEPTIRSVSRQLSQEFVNQNVTGAKIAGGLVSPCVPLFVYLPLPLPVSVSLPVTLCPYVSVSLAPSLSTPFPSFCVYNTLLVLIGRTSASSLPHAFHPALIRSSVGVAACCGSVFTIGGCALFTITAGSRSVAFCLRARGHEHRSVFRQRDPRPQQGAVRKREGGRRDERGGKGGGRWVARSHLLVLG